MKLYCEHEINMSAEEFWSIIHNEGYEQKIVEILPLNKMETLERKEDDKEIYRHLHVIPPIPANMEKLLSKLPGNLDPSYEEKQWRSKSEMSVRWSMVPAMLGKKAEFSGIVRIEAKDANSCLRILDGEVKIKILGVGKLFEKAIVNETIKSYGATAKITNDIGRSFLP